MNIGKIIIGVVLGAFAAHVWGMVSWMALSWHMDPIQPLENEDAIAAAIAAGAPDGANMFLIPHPAECLAPDATAETKAAHEEAFVKGPFVYGVVRTGEVPFNMGVNAGKTFATNFVLALIAGILLAGAAGNLNYFGRVVFVLLIGLFAGIWGNVPNHIWWEHPASFIGVNIADGAVTWLIAGLVMAALIKPAAEVSAE